PYFLQLREVNQAGPRLYGQRPPALAQLTVAQFDAVTAAGAEVIDVRSIDEFSSGHVPESLSIALRPQFATWLGWLVDRKRPIVFVADEGVDRSQLVRSCLRIGFERLTGELTGGAAAWSAAGRQLSRIPLVRPGEDDAERRIIDVRQRSEWNQAHLSGALGVELGAINDRWGELAGAPALVHCSHGERAMTAASLLARGGNPDVAVLDGGPEELAAASDLDLQMP
ncbi:MAG TPA: rhodanese-like domain-containing protein, partial [Egibacteraceae bacterium]|nr:rhodanese-like domain-containing protein [Egibacteraceae bacterium]